ncbi:cyclin-D3-2 [Nicotiana tabacum]|uniref:Cyclin-D3-2 n=1 Tax=Nicotiana tabacum TaxID=4097 RepID=A0A1S3Z2A0_TOBAC
MVFPLDTQLLNPIFDGLYCEEDRFLDDHDDLGEWSCTLEQVENNLKKTLPLLECDMFWEDDQLVTLLTKEKESHLGFDCLISDGDGFLVEVRKEALDWMLRVIAHYGFTAMTAVLAVNYFDRFVSGLCFQKDKPWMSQLAAVACLSIAAKVEETQVPLLLDLQVADSRFVFEAKTIQRMELLVLSTLKWKMNPVTPLSFIDHIMRRFGFMSNIHLDFLRRCERLILGIITDSRLLHYPPSVIATAAMYFVINEIEPCNAMEYQNQLTSVLKVKQDSFEECRDLILELIGTSGYKICQGVKRKHQSVPGSPSGVIDAYFSCDSSNDSWSVASSISSSPEPQYKRIKTQDQTMTLAPLSSVSVVVGSSPH